MTLNIFKDILEQFSNLSTVRDKLYFCVENKNGMQLDFRLFPAYIDAFPIIK